MDIVIEELGNHHNYQEYLLLLKQLSTVNLDKITEAEFKSRLSQIQSNPNHKIIVATSGGKIIGSITVLVEMKFIHDLGNVAHIEDVVVDGTVRSSGIGRLLVNKAIEMSKNYDCYKIILDCSKNCIEFYEKLGFKQNAHQMALYLN